MIFLDLQRARLWLLAFIAGSALLSSILLYLFHFPSYKINAVFAAAVILLLCFFLYMRGVDWIRYVSLLWISVLVGLAISPPAELSEVGFIIIVPAASAFILGETWTVSASTLVAWAIVAIRANFNGSTVGVFAIIGLVLVLGLLVLSRLLVVSTITSLRSAETEVRTLNAQLEERVAQRTRELEEATGKLIETEKFAALGSLVAGVAHEINTPLGVSITATSFLGSRTAEFRSKVKEGVLTRSMLDEFVELVSDAQSIQYSNLQRAAEMVQNFKRIAVDQAIETLYEFDLEEYTKSVFLSLRHELKRASHEYTIVCKEKITVRGSPGAIFQILTNLIMNSIIHGFTQKSKGSMTVSLSEHESTVFLVYHDNGSGIPAATQSRIFEPFFTTRRNEGSSGLGLNIVYNLVVGRMGGTVSCESAPDQGTTFIITFPRILQDELGR